MATAFDDLVPKGKATDDPFGDLIPKGATPAFTAPQQVAAPDRFKGGGQATFSDENPAAPDLAPDVKSAYETLSKDPSSTVDTLLNFWKQHGVDPENTWVAGPKGQSIPYRSMVEDFVAKRNSGAQVSGVAIAPRGEAPKPDVFDPEQQDIADGGLSTFLKRGAYGVNAGVDRAASAVGGLNNVRMPWESDDDYNARLGSNALDRQGNLGWSPSGLDGGAREAESLSQTPIAGEQTWEDLKAHPQFGKLASFVGQQALQSLPMMGTALEGGPGFIVSSAGQLAQERARNDGRQDAGLGDLISALPFAAAGQKLQESGIESVLAPEGANAAVRTGAAMVGSGAAGAGMTGVDYLGSHAGTDAPFDPSELADQMASAGVAGAGMGVAHGAMEAPEAVRAASEASRGLPAYVSSLALDAPPEQARLAPVEPVSQPSIVAPTAREAASVSEATPQWLEPKAAESAFSDLVPQSAAAPEGQPVEPQPAAVPAKSSGELGQQPYEPMPFRPGLPRDEVQPETQTVRTPAGTKVQTRPEVVDASTLNKAEGALQNRDRTRDTTALQTQDIISKFDPELLGHDPSSDRGAPIVDENGTVLSGNGRMLALNQIHDDPALAEKRQAYIDHINSLGYDTTGVDKPVLVRRLAEPMDDAAKRQFVIENNSDSKLELSPVERARSDADSVTPEMLSKYAGGDLNSTANKNFVSEFMKSRTAADLGGMLESKDRLSTKGVERIENAVVAKAYDNPKLLEKLMESSQNEIRAITSSLANVAPAWASMREAAKGGEIGKHYDITSDLSDAAMRVAEARNRGEKPADILSQQDAFNRLSPETEGLIRAFYNPEMTRPASVKSVTGFLRDYVDEASSQRPGEDMFGEKSDGKAPQDILNELLRQRDGGDAPLLNLKENGNEQRADDGQGEARGIADRNQGRDHEDGRAVEGEESGARQEEGAAEGPSSEKTREDERPADDGEPTASSRPGDTEPGERTSGSEPRQRGSGSGPDAERGRPERLDGPAELEDKAPADASQGGAYARTHAKGATTDHASDLRSAVEHLGMTWDDFNLKAAPTQVHLLQRAINEKLGIKVTVDKGGERPALQYRLAIDQMLDAFHNISGMAAILDLPEKAMSLNGTLSLELRKNAKFYGAFYPGEEKIALPGRSNSFAHEWGHALDFYLMGELGGSNGNGLSGVVRKYGSSRIEHPEIASAFGDLMKSMFFDKASLAQKIMELETKKAATKSESVQRQLQRQIDRIQEGAGQQRGDRSDYYKAARATDGPIGEPGGGYWQSPTEMMARAFEAYVAHKAEDAGMSTEVISHADADYLSDADARLQSTFPKGDERQAIFDSFDNLLDAVRDAHTLGDGEAATIPENPAKRADVTPEGVSAFRRIVKNELAAREDARRSKEKAADQPKDPKGLAQKANDVRHFFFSGAAAEMRALGRRWNSKAIMELHDKLVPEPGAGNRLQNRDLVTGQRLRSNRYSNQIEHALKESGPKSWGDNATTLTKEQAVDLHRIMTNEAAEDFGADPKLKTLASKFREVADGIWHDLRNAGFDLGYTKNGYLPRMYDRTKILSDKDGFLEQAWQMYEAQGLEPKEAVKAAADWYNNFVEQSPMNFDRTQPQGEFLKGRKLGPEADELMRDYMINEPVDLMRRYAQSAAHRIEWAKRFGIDNSKLNDLYNRMGHEGVDQRDRQTIKTMVDIMSGNNPMRQKNETLNAAGSAINVIYGQVKLLGRAVFQHIAEPIVAGMVLEHPKYGVKAFVDNVAGLIGTASAKERKEIAEFVGLMRSGNTSRIMADNYGGSFDDSANWQRISQKLFYNTGLTALTEHKMAHGQGVINAYLQTLSNKLLRAVDRGGQSALTESAGAREVLSRFNELGIRDPIPFARWMTGLDGKLPSKAELAEGMDEKGKAPWAYDWMTATKRLSTRITQEPHALTKSLFSHSGVIGKLMTGILAFHYAQYDTVTKPIFKRLAERISDDRGAIATKGAAASLAGLASLYMGYFGTTALRVYLTDQQRWKDEEANGTLMDYLAERTATTFMGDPLDPLVQAITGLKYQRDLAANALGPAAGNIAQDITRIAKLGVANSRKTNTAEHNAIQGAYGLITPWASAAIGAVPGGPILSGLQGVAQGYLTSQQGGNTAADLAVGKKNARPLPHGGKVESGPTAYDLWLDKHFPKPEKN